MACPAKGQICQKMRLNLVILQSIPLLQIQMALFQV